MPDKYPYKLRGLIVELPDDKLEEYRRNNAASTYRREKEYVHLMFSQMRRAKVVFEDEVE